MKKWHAVKRDRDALAACRRVITYTYRADIKQVVARIIECSESNIAQDSRCSAPDFVYALDDCNKLLHAYQDRLNNPNRKLDLAILATASSACMTNGAKAVAFWSRRADMLAAATPRRAAS